MTYLRMIPLLMIFTGLIGVAYCGWRRDRMHRALIVLKWCELEQIEISLKENPTHKGACAAFQQYLKMGNDIAPLIAFYDKKPDAATPPKSEGAK